MSTQAGRQGSNTQPGSCNSIAVLPAHALAKCSEELDSSGAEGVGQLAAGHQPAKRKACKAGGAGGRAIELAGVQLPRCRPPLSAVLHSAAATPPSRTVARGLAPGNDVGQHALQLEGPEGGANPAKAALRAGQRAASARWLGWQRQQRCGSSARWCCTVPAPMRLAALSRRAAASQPHLHLVRHAERSRRPHLSVHACQVPWGEDDLRQGQVERGRQVSRHWHLPQKHM